MSLVKRWIGRARAVAEEHLPQDVVEAGRRLKERVAEHAPPAVRDVLDRYVGDDSAASDRSARDRYAQDDDDLVRVVVYATDAEREAVEAIRRAFAKISAPIRVIDLSHDPKTARQMATLTNVMVPPYVYIHGRFWGAQYDVESLLASGDLEKIVDSRLDEISEGARRVGNVHESFSDAMTVDNIVDRLRRGHILSIDDLDCWLEQDKDGTEHLYYDGARHPADELERVATEISAKVDAEEVQATWRFEPEVHV